MKTSKQWWESVKNDPVLLNDWLQRQYYGEVQASIRIKDLIKPDMESKTKNVLSTIAEQESKHAKWIGSLLSIRGINILEDHTSRYWNEVLDEDGSQSFEELCAVGHHAETMRLERIKVIAEDETHPDITKIFKMILMEELFHARAFAKLSTKEMIKKTEKFHEKGLNSLGLVV